MSYRGGEILYIRTGNLKLDVIDNIYSETNGDSYLLNLLNMEGFMNTIKISSPSLFCSIIADEDFIHNNSIKFSLVKYALRMSSRSVNYDLFGNLSSDKFNQTVIKASFSTNWIDMFLRKTIKYCNLDMTYNRNILELDEYYFLHSYSHTQRKNKNIKINRNSFLGKIVENFISKNILTYKELYDVVYYKLKVNEKTESIIDYLIDNSILFFDFNSYTKDLKLKEYTSIMINNIENNNVYSDLIGMYQKIKYMDKLTEEKISIINDVERLMEDIFTQNQIEALQSPKKLIYEPYKQCSPEKLAEEHNINKIGDLKFLRLMNVLDDWFATINLFETSLIQKYGEYFEISFKKLLAEDSLLREIIFDKNMVKNSSVKQDVTLLLNNIVLEAILSGKSVNLDEKYVTELSQLLETGLYKKKKIYSLDVDVKYQLLNDKLFLTPIAFGFPEHSFISKYTELKCTQTNSVYAYMNLKTNFNTDVGRNYVDADNVIDFYGFEDNGITIDKLIIGHDELGIYLKDSVRGKKVIPVFCSFADLKYDCENKIAFFLQQLGRYIMMPPVNFLEHCNINFPVLPRICCGDIILSKKRWYFNKASVSKDQFVKNLGDFITRHNLPNKVCLYHNGEEMPIFFNSNHGIDITYQYFHKYNFVVFTEYFFDKLKEDYFTEYIDKVHFEGEDFNVEVDKSIKILEELTLSEYETFIIILEELLYDKLILMDIISSYLEKEFYKFFFINYIDDGVPSIRLRIRKFTGNYSQETLINFLIKLQQEGKIRYFYLGKYYNELERYGGSEYKVLINEIFEIDSKISIEMLSIMQHRNENIIAYTLLFFKEFYEDIDEAIKSFERYSWTNENAKNYAKILRSDINIERIKFFMENKNVTDKEMFIKLANLSKNLKLKKSKRSKVDNVLHSLVHMSFNRKDISGIEESKMLWFIKKILIRIKYTS